MDLTRRFFLGGALSVVAASTFVPRAVGNLPTIYADGAHDDTSGLGALLRREPVIFSRDHIGLDDHKGIVFHHGRFIITQTIEVPDDVSMKVEGVTFDLRKLDLVLPAFRGRADAIVQLTGLFTKWYCPRPRADGRWSRYGTGARTVFLETLYEAPTQHARRFGYDMANDSVG